MVLSSPNENYIKHVNLVVENLRKLFPVFEPTIKRVLEYGEEDCLEDTFVKMALFHDLGKLTKRWQDRLRTTRWQDRLRTTKKLPSHAPIGAAYLWKILPKGLKEPISFAVAIHHTDRGLIGDNIERPDVQAINQGITDNYPGSIIWSENANCLDNNYFPNDVKGLDVDDLKRMAGGLRLWSRGCPFLEQHKRRMQASLVHHIIKLCDVSAARNREEYKDNNNNEKNYSGGWLMSRQIGKYVDSISCGIK